MDNKYWLSLEQWRQDPEFLKLAEQEFLSSPLQSEDGKDGWARREFLKLMGASIALTSFGCVRKAQKIVPYANRPKEIVNGIANYYASSLADANEVFGVVITTREGRPIKIDGNPDHPWNQGGMSARAHAAILSLYDPDRLSGPKQNLLNEKKTNRETINVTYESADEVITKQLKKGGVALLSGSVFSPSTRQLIGDFSQTYGAKNYYWDAMSYDDLKEAQAACYGTRVVPQYRFDQARMILAIECDFLGSHLNAAVNSRRFAKGRTPGPDMSKLVVVESLMSLTGSNADERYAVRPSRQLNVLMGIIQHLVEKKKVSRYAGDADVKRVVAQYSTATADLPEGKLAELAEELWQHRGRGLVVAGNSGQGEHSLGLQIAANFLNSLLENDGVTINGTQTVAGFQGSNRDLAELIEAANKGQIKTLVIHGCNPVYAAASSGLAEALTKVEMVIYTGDRNDETGRMANYVLPDHHALENWGDMESAEDVFAIQQPTIEPLYQTRAFQDSLITWAKAGSAPSRVKQAESWFEYLWSNWRSQIYRGGKSFDDFWLETLHSGVYARKSIAERGSSRGFNKSALSKIPGPKTVEHQELVLYSTVGLRDGSLANVSWLQEFPDPVTKICWDNYLCVSPADATMYRLHEGDQVELLVGENKTLVPVHIQPGQAKGTLGLAIGYGRTASGKVANGVGISAYPFVKWESGRALAYLSAQIGGAIKKAGKYQLANVQGHNSMEGRQIVVEATLAQFMKNPSANIHRHKVITMWPEHQYPNNKWGMVIDLNTCTGCGSCVIACQSENNVPTVGKRYVLQGREMHWLRIDRYYVGEPENPDVVTQPVLCQHCDNAPCETVCPVLATVHSDEGTNDMIYNRCVGTRYCSNNCPYKVRRFNWFNLQRNTEKPLNYAMNPDVTVRARGVMEKCTFCIHRIRTVKQQAKVQERQLKDGDVKTACQQSCPTNAIVFGDLNDPESQVRKLADNARNYTLLEELNAKPAVRYQSKIRNTAALKGEAQKGHH